MKKLTALLLALTVLFSINVFASEPEFSSVTLHISVSESEYGFKTQTLTFDLRDGDTNILLGAETLDIYNGSPRFYDLTFSVPAYEIGKTFILHMSEGEAELTYNGAQGAYFILQTYSAPNSDLTGLEYCTDFYMELNPANEKIVNLSLDGEIRSDLALYTYPEGILISASALSALGIKINSLTDGGISLYNGETSLLLYPGQLCAYRGSEAFNLSLAPQSINGELYVPVADTASVFGCAIEYSDDGHTLNLALGYSSVNRTADERTINNRGVSSDTNYLIWVSKSEYTLRVYKGSAGSWHRVNSFSCAIGAPATPTCEGTYKYYQYQTRWEYPTYYVGPIMRFNGGFAIHSTLLRYNGTPADNRVGVRISHGCIRLRPENINWLAAAMPLYTTVYVTA